MINTQNLIRQKANYEKICDFKTTGSLFFPRENVKGMMYVVSNTGEIFFFNEGTSEQVYSLNGVPNCICYDSSGSFYVAELENPAIFYKPHLNDNNPLVEQILVKDYEGEPLKGPTSLAYNTEEDVMYVTDAGNFQDSNVYSKTGSLYLIDLDTNVMKSILHNCLSYPADVIYDEVSGNLFIADTFSNRILRVTQHPDGIYRSTIFCQFNGRVGPTALAIGEYGNLYVARYEFHIDLEQESDGLISVLNPQGTIIGELTLPKLPEITGLLIPAKKKESLYLTEKNSNGVIKIKLSSFISELDKMEENNKF